MSSFRSFVGRHPRIATSLAFGLAATALVYVSWIPGPMGRLEGYRLLLAAGFTHAFAGAISGPRVIYPSRQPKLLHAGLWGAGASLLALLLISFMLTIDIVRTGRETTHPFILVFLTFVFSFLGAGWAHMLLSAAIGCGLHAVAAQSPSTEGRSLSPD
ncbi:MAG TPA: hypothetical protein VI758_08505 [Bacteroidota bacterium]